MRKFVILVLSIAAGLCIAAAAFIFFGKGNILIGKIHKTAGAVTAVAVLVHVFLNRKALLYSLKAIPLRALVILVLAGGIGAMFWSTTQPDLQFRRPAAQSVPVPPEQIHE